MLPGHIHKAHHEPLFEGLAPPPIYVTKPDKTTKQAKNQAEAEEEEKFKQRRPLWVREAEGGKLTFDEQARVEDARKQVDAQLADKARREFMASKKAEKAIENG